MPSPAGAIHLSTEAHYGSWEVDMTRHSVLCEFFADDVVVREISESKFMFFQAITFFGGCNATIRSRIRRKFVRVALAAQAKCCPSTELVAFSNTLDALANILKEATRKFYRLAEQDRLAELYVLRVNSRCIWLLQTFYKRSCSSWKLLATFPARFG